MPIQPLSRINMPIMFSIKRFTLKCLKMYLEFPTFLQVMSLNVLFGP